MKKVKINWIKILSVLCAICITFLTVASGFAMAASGSPVSWDDVSDDVIALRDAYFAYFSSLGDKNFFSNSIKAAADIPISWVKTVNDLGWCISPVDNIYYYLKDGKLSIRSTGGGERIRSGTIGGGGYCRTCRKPAAECTCDNFDGDAEDFTPFVSGKDLKDSAADYNSRYMPMANEDQYFYHYQGDNMTHSDSSSWYFTPFCPVYLFEKQWGNKGWTDFYFLPVVNDDNVGTFYGQQYGHIYSKNVDGTVTMYFDLINMTDGSNYYSTSFVYDASTYKWIGLIFNGDLYDIYGFSSSYNYWNTLLVGGQYKQYGPFVTGISLYSTSNVSAALKWTIMASTFTPKTNKNDDWGYLLSNKPFELFANQTSIDFDKIPDNYVITINGDTIYDYSVTNPDTGDSTTINNYITNNYVIPEGEKKDDGSSSGGSVSGSVTVGGKVDVSGDITIKSDPININVNVNSGSSSGGSAGTGEAVRFDQDIGLNNYYNWMQEQTTGFSGFMKNFFGWLPADIVIMLCAGFGLVILARFLGR